MTSQEVSGSAKTLKQAIKDSDVESPALMDWNQWQKWRKDKGKRPNRRVDGSSTKNAAEVKLWIATMLSLHGAD